MTNLMPDTEENNSLIDMRFSQIPDNSGISSVVQITSEVASEDYDSTVHARGQPRNESPNTKEYRYAISNLRS